MQRSRIRRPPGQMRLVVAENLKAELLAKYPAAPDQTSRLDAFERSTGISKETTRRVIKAQNAANLDTLEIIADGLSIPTYRLLVPSEHMTRKFQPFDETTVITKAPDFSNMEQPVLHSSRKIEDAAQSRRLRRGQVGARRKKG